MREVRFPADRVHVQEYEHPDGSVDVFTLVRAPESMWATRVGLQSHRPMTVLMSLSRNAHGITNFEAVRLDPDEDERVFEMTDAQFEAFRADIADLVAR
jgi:hypothetical protein